MSDEQRDDQYRAGPDRASTRTSADRVAADGIGDVRSPIVLVQAMIVEDEA